ncbi:MAG: Glycerol uptake facilitator protein [uncultured Rubrobacteraceae bacterium]|uniref:Glycerol uptake facilitator protein n=1 Tax=uncultured Rubrobacteraceae bacterium TaxID=349277 RepID=A0A6J4QYF0_9ACTN|nr:MAG: Glycerol uptake facilitator protein [uncultured Rubrobacteraceae bacterium]
MFEAYLAEFIGTALLVLLGDGVVAGVLLKNSKAENGGWIVITVAWAVAVAIAVYAVGRVSGAHINPAVTIALASIGAFPLAQVPGYIIAQMLGAFAGAVLVYVHYLPHWRETEDPNLKLGVFSTGPAIRETGSNFISEFIGTAVLLFGILAIGANAGALAAGDVDLSVAYGTALAPLLVGLLVLVIGLSLGGTTGYAINPARDLGPRIAHAILPIAGKGGSDWGYSWIPVVAPIAGGIVGALLFQLTIAP